MRTTNGTPGTFNHPIMGVVVAYGPEQQLADCLKTVGRDLAIVVIDNGRSDEARRICAEAGASYFRPETNIGFAAAVNTAVREHRVLESDILLLNPDARLTTRNLSVMCHELHRTADLAAVSPRLINSDGSDQKVLWPIPSPGTALAAVIGAADQVSRNQFVSGAVLLLRGAALDSIGLFDERFFLYAEETDWQLRATRSGWRVAVISEATAVHLGGGTSSDPRRREILFNASGEIFARKWYGTVGWQVVRLAAILAATRRLITSRDRDSRAVQRRSIGDYLRGPVKRAEALSRTA
jgi:GT2 family glycosyltransferase